MAHSRYCLGGGIEYLSGCSSAREALLADSIAMYYGVRFAVHGDIHSFGCSFVIICWSLQLYRLTCVGSTLVGNHPWRTKARFNGLVFTNF